MSFPKTASHPLRRRSGDFDILPSDKMALVDKNGFGPRREPKRISAGFSSGGAGTSPVLVVERASAVLRPFNL
jgi:hypothetical protein